MLKYKKFNLFCRSVSCFIRDNKRRFRILPSTVKGKQPAINNWLETGKEVTLDGVADITEIIPKLITMAGSCKFKPDFLSSESEEVTK